MRIYVLAHHNICLFYLTLTTMQSAAIFGRDGSRPAPNHYGFKIGRRQGECTTTYTQSYPHPHTFPNIVYTSIFVGTRVERPSRLHVFPCSNPETEKSVSRPVAGATVGWYTRQTTQTEPQYRPAPDNM